MNKDKSTNPVMAFAEPFSRLINAFASLSALPKIEGNVLLTPGHHVIISDTGGGKSTLVENLSAQAKGIIIEIDEPYKTSYGSLNEMEADLVNEDGTPTDRLVALAADTKGVLVIDSLRLIQFEIPGPATAGAVSSGLYRFLTMLTIAATRAGVSVISTMNPLTESGSDDFNRLMTRIQSSVTSVVYGAQDNWVVSSRNAHSRVEMSYSAPLSSTAKSARTSAADHVIVKPSRAMATELGYEALRNLKPAPAKDKGLSEATDNPVWAEDDSLTTILSNLNWEE